MDVVRFLVEVGANPHAVDINEITALDHASTWGLSEVVRYLSEFKADSHRRKLLRLNDPGGAIEGEEKRELTGVG